MRDTVTTLLDTFGLCLVAAGATGAAWPLIGSASLAVGGVLLLGGSALAARGDRS